MKKVFMVVCMLTFAFMISAQGGQGGQGGGQGGQGGGQRQGGGMRQQTPEQIAERQAQMKKDLNLNDKQFAEYKKIDEEMTKKQQTLFQNAQNSGGGFDREAFTKLNDERTAKMKALLTADQFKKYEELLAAQRQRMAQGGGGGQRQN